MKERLQISHGLQDPEKVESSKYDNHISWSFYLRLLIFKVVPPCFCCDKNRVEEHAVDGDHQCEMMKNPVTFTSMVEHYDELIDQVYFALSIKRIATQITVA